MQLTTLASKHGVDTTHHAHEAEVHVELMLFVLLGSAQAKQTADGTCI